MKCENAIKLILLEDAGELETSQSNNLKDHIDNCENCRKYAALLVEARTAVVATEEPPAHIMQSILREARKQAPTKKVVRFFGLKPALAMAASVMIGLGIFFSSYSPNEVGMEIVMSDTQLLDTEEQAISIMYEGLSEDDLAFHFLMAYDG